MESAEQSPLIKCRYGPLFLFVLITNIVQAVVTHFTSASAFDHRIHDFLEGSLIIESKDLRLSQIMSPPVNATVF